MRRWKMIGRTVSLAEGHEEADPLESSSNVEGGPNEIVASHGDTWIPSGKSTIVTR